ncbi:MAG: AAA family ATPase [Sarcina sp.]
MNKINMVVVDQDERYVTAIEYIFVEKSRDIIDLESITDLRYLDEFFSVPREIDILIINERLYSDNIKRQAISNIFLLSEELPKNDDTGVLNLYVLYKYSSVRDIHNEVMNKSKLDKVRRTNETKIITVYSPGGGTGKTTVALGMAGAISSSNKKVLYVNTETLQNFNYFINREAFINNVKFENLFINRDEELINYFSEVKGEHKFDYLLPFRQSLSGVGIGLNEYLFFLERIKEMKKYDFIIVDTSSDFTIEKSKLMGESFRVLVVTTQSLNDTYKLNSLKQNIDCTNERFIFICNKYDERLNNYLIDEKYLSGVNIGEYINYVNEKEADIDILCSNKDFTKLVYKFI